MPKGVKSKEKFIEQRNKTFKEIKDINGDKFEILGEYKNSKEPIKCHCNICDRDFFLPTEKLRLKRKFCNRKDCRYSEKPKNSKGKETFLIELKDKFGFNYTYIEGFNGMNKKCRFRCGKCGNIRYFAKPSTLMDKRKKYNSVNCNRCINDENYIILDSQELSKKTTEEFQGELDMIFGYNKFNVLTEYTRSKDYIYLKSNDCGHKFKTRPDDILKRKRCSVCSKSIGEIAIIEFLQENNIEYENEVTFEGSSFRFDFYFKKINTVVEVDGKGHIKGYGTFINDKRNKRTRTLEDIKKLDNEKDKFIRSKGINMIRLPYQNRINEELIIPMKKLLKL
ncbi:homing endonuclease [Staphylococcus phage vB_StaM_PB50]|nr:homing endonuclease [Staphylococcus phage vB_StaM_PB50]